ncbi:carboxymuconolactone decarboxylase family protein [Campylobacter sp. CH185]|nr:carboxymuconolactone decarboxylase family protein [Campylobacter sp. CH186]TEY40402.1 carboxymuconolactone decarboxylase family protein [Campylobacter sp. CH185]
MGFARVCDFLSLCNKAFKKLNIALSLTSQDTTTQENRKIKGREIQNAIFGEANITKMIESTLEDKAFINDFLSANCFGDYYTRTGLDLKTRELLTLVYLISLGGLDNQVKAHIQGNLNMGQSRKDLLNIIAALIPYIGYPRALNAIAVLDSLTL